MVLITFATQSGIAQVLMRYGNEVRLHRSARYAALQLRPGVNSESAGVTAAVPAGDTRLIVSDSPVLRTKRVIMVRGALPGQKAETPAQGPHLTAAASDVGQELPVYDLEGIDVVATGEILVRPSAPAARELEADLSRLGTLARLARGAYMLTVHDPNTTLDVAKGLAVKGGVEYAEPNFITIIPPRPKIIAIAPAPAPAAPAADFPRDPLFPQQWSLANAGGKGRKAGADIRARAAWALADGANTTIAILDEGVDALHPDLRGKIVSPFDAILNRVGQQPHSWDVHGTACAGIAAASTNNAIGMAGVGYKARILPVKIASTDRSGGEWITTTEILARGIEYAVDHGADVISNSWGGGDLDPHIADAIRYGLSRGRNNKGAVIVFAAGNEGGEVSWPARLALTTDVIAVSATNEWDELKTRTSRDGEDWWASNIGTAITVAAPGVHILTTGISGVAGKAAYFSGFNGTSSATPHVAGAAALLLSKEPQLSAAEVKRRLHDTADRTGPPDQVGGGRLNVCRAVRASGC
jgi:subtilisin family serine protease